MPKEPSSPLLLLLRFEGGLGYCLIDCGLKVTNPDIANPTGIPYLDCLLHRLLDAQQDINVEANERMSQELCYASAVIDEVETAIRTLARLRPRGDASHG